MNENYIKQQTIIQLIVRAYVKSNMLDIIVILKENI